jgi:hypothetical protein
VNYWFVALLGGSLGTGVALILRQVIRMRRETTVRRLVEWSFDTDTRGRDHAQRMLSQLLKTHDRSAPDSPSEPGKVELPDVDA